MNEDTMTEENTICYPLPVLTPQQCKDPFLRASYHLGTSCDGITQRCFYKATPQECADPIYHLTHPFVFGCADYQIDVNSTTSSQNPPIISTKPILPTFLLTVAALHLLKLSLKKLKSSFHQEQIPQVQKDIEPTEKDISIQDSYYVQLRKYVSSQNDKAHTFFRNSIQQHLSKQEQPFFDLFFDSSNPYKGSSGSPDSKSSKTPTL